LTVEAASTTPSLTVPAASTTPSLTEVAAPTTPSLTALSNAIAVFSPFEAASVVASQAADADCLALSKMEAPDTTKMKVRRIKTSVINCFIVFGVGIVYLVEGGGVVVVVLLCLIKLLGSKDANVCFPEKNSANLFYPKFSVVVEPSADEPSARMDRSWEICDQTRFV